MDLSLPQRPSLPATNSGSTPASAFSGLALTTNLSPEEVKEYLLEPMRASVTDKSWRVRYMVANEFVGLAEGVGETVIREELVGSFVGLLKDNEAEVRTAAAGQIPGEVVDLLTD